MIYKYNAHLSFAEMYGICADDFEKMKIEDASLADTYKNALILNEIHTVADLLKMVPGRLRLRKRVTDRCIQAVHKMWDNLKCENGESASRYERIRVAKSDIVILAYMPGEKQEYEFYDPTETFLPEGIESAPKRFATSWRNKWMVRESQVVVCYITHSWGGAAQFVEYAEKQGKEIINLATKD